MRTPGEKERGLLSTLLRGKHEEDERIEEVEKGRRRRRRRRRSKPSSRERSSSLESARSHLSSSSGSDRRYPQQRRHKDARARSKSRPRYSEDVSLQDIRIPSPSGHQSVRPSTPPRSLPKAIERSDALPRSYHTPTRVSAEPTYVSAEPAYVSIPTRSSYYTPHERDFVIPRVVRPGAAATFPPPKSRADSTTISSSGLREERDERRSRRPPAANPSFSRAPREESRRRRRRSMNEERIHEEREPRRRQLSFDEEARQPRSISPPVRRPPAKQKKGGGLLEHAKWLALLPLALRAINIVAEPSGGWEQYFGDDKDKKKGSTRSSRRPRSMVQDRRPERERMYGDHLPPRD